MLFLRRAHSPVIKKYFKKNKREALFKQTELVKAALSMQALYTALYTTALK